MTVPTTLTQWGREPRERKSVVVPETGLDIGRAKTATTPTRITKVNVQHMCGRGISLPFFMFSSV